jgi:hypothetical protein
MSIILPGNTAGFSTDALLGPGKWTMAHKGSKEVVMKEKRRV